MLVANMRRRTATDGRQYLAGRTIAPVDEDTMVWFEKVTDTTYALKQIRKLSRPDGEQIALEFAPIKFLPELSNECDATAD